MSERGKSDKDKALFANLIMMLSFGFKLWEVFQS